MTVRTKKQILGQKGYQQPKITGDLKKIIKLSANENLFGPSPTVERAIEKVNSSENLKYYPDATSSELRNKLADFLKIDSQQLIFGDGLDEIIEILFRSVLTADSNVILSKPYFSVYALQARIEAAAIKEISVLADGHVDFKKLLSAIDDKTNLIVLTNPNNPTGIFESIASIDVFLSKVPTDVTVFIDEAYVDFVEDDPSSAVVLIKKYPNLIVGRTFSKAYALANLRIGYAAANEELVKILETVRLPYNLSGFQQAAALAAIADQEYLKRVVAEIILERKKWLIFLKENGYRFYYSQANFIYVKAERIGDLLNSTRENGIDINGRLGTGWVRFAIGKKEDNEKLRSIFLKSSINI